MRRAQKKKNLNIKNFEKMFFAMKIPFQIMIKYYLFWKDLRFSRSENVDFLIIDWSKSAGAKGDVPNIYEFVHRLHPC